MGVQRKYTVRDLATLANLQMKSVRKYHSEQGIGKKVRFPDGRTKIIFSEEDRELLGLKGIKIMATKDLNIVVVSKEGEWRGTVQDSEYCGEDEYVSLKKAEELTRVSWATWWVWADEHLVPYVRTDMRFVKREIVESIGVAYTLKEAQDIIRARTRIMAHNVLLHKWDKNPRVAFSLGKFPTGYPYVPLVELIKFLKAHNAVTDDLEIELLNRRETKSFVAIIIKNRKEGYLGFLTASESAYNYFSRLMNDIGSPYQYGLALKPTIKDHNGLYVGLTEIVESSSLTDSGKGNRLERELVRNGYAPVYLKIEMDGSKPLIHLERRCIALMYDCMLRM